MNKTKKLAFAVTSMVMAGTMLFSMAACQPGSSSSGGGGMSADLSITKPTLSADLTPKTDANDNLTYDAGTSLSINMGNQNNTHPAHITFQSGELSGSVTLPDGKDYSTGDLKPAWQSLADTLDLNFVDNFKNYGSDAQIENAISEQNIQDFDFISGSVSAITQNSTYFLNLKDYLYYMPNYAAFLEKYETVSFSLTSDVTNGGMFYAPYFDGMDDIEKYALAEKTWISDLLDGENTDTTTFKAQAESKGKTGTSVTMESYIGKTGSWEVDTTSADGKSVVKAKVNYDAALSAVKSSSSALGQAYNAAAGTAYTGTSGNIVDIMNAAINAKAGEVTGAQLTAMLKAYIDVAYTLDGKAYTKRSDVFNSVSACWDVDLFVALSRCAVTSPTVLGANANQLSNIYGLSARQGTTQRRVDLTAFAGELFGIRGMESRYEYTYINSKGNMVDARANSDSYDLVAKLSHLEDEGILYSGTSNINAARDFTGPSSLFMHDYSQTQTTAGFSDEDFNVAPVLTPVSKWDTNDDGERETIMRFTESWRSVKNTGFAVPVSAVKGNSNKLSAVLKFIDYLFSNDGQLLMTYGEISTNGNTNPNGWWYATEATDVNIADVAEKVTVDISNPDNKEGVKPQIVSDQYSIKDAYKSKYFVYKGKVYTGFNYLDTQVPTVTTDSMNLFLGEEVNGFKQGVSTSISAIGNYTNYARWVVGTTLPLGNKNQGFEYQCTADCALAGADIVSQAISNGTIKHLELSLADVTSWWYLIAPTSIALDTSMQETMGSPEQSQIGTYFLNSSKTNQRLNVFLDLLYYGFDTSLNICDNENYGKIKANGTEYVTWLNNNGLTVRTNIFSICWSDTKTLFNLNLAD